VVDHKATCWAVADDDDRLGEDSSDERATALFNEQLGDEDKKSWREHAPNEPHPSVENEQRLTRTQPRFLSGAT